MNINYENRAVSDSSYDLGLRAYMLKVYNYMSLGLLLTAIVAFLVASSPALVNAIYASPLGIIVMLAPFGFVLALSFGINKLKTSTAQLLFWAFAAVMGVSMSYVLLLYTGASVARVFFITSAMFLAMSLYGYTTKKDLSRMGSLLIMALFGIIIASIVNIFLKSTAMDFAISLIGVVVFTGLTAWDTQKIKRQFDSSMSPDTLKKTAILGALSLYLDFINLFLMLLRVIGDRR